jgi:DNA end-binding protein Ku
MGHAIWTGAINFGLVTIPVKLFTAVRGNDLAFHFLHGKDKGRVNNVRRCSECGKEVAWNDIVRGFEYEKGEYVVLSPEDFKRADVEATQSVDIVEFVELAEIDPMFFDKPYYLEPEKKGRHAYALLRDALAASGKVGVARVVIRAHEHLAALKPHGKALVLELMHFAQEIVPASEYEFPPLDAKAPPKEMAAAQMLIDTMTAKFDPTQFHDKYKEELLAMIEARAHHRTPAKKKAGKAAPSNVVNLMDVLQASLAETKRHRGAAGKTVKKANGHTNGKAKTHAKAKRHARAGAAAH